MERWKSCFNGISAIKTRPASGKGLALLVLHRKYGYHVHLAGSIVQSPSTLMTMRAMPDTAAKRTPATGQTSQVKSQRLDQKLQPK